MEQEQQDGATAAAATTTPKKNQRKRENVNFIMQIIHIGVSLALYGFTLDINLLWIFCSFYSADSNTLSEWKRVEKMFSHRDREQANTCTKFVLF